MKPYITVSFSGGKDSTALVLRLIELGEHIDEVVCCDTGKEFPAMYYHIARVREIVEDNGIKFTLLESDKTFDYYMFEHKVNPRNKNVSKKGYSWAWSKNRWCTHRLKQLVISRHFKELRKKYNVIQCLGIATDETHRIDRKNNSGEGVRLPLVEWGWSEKDCLQYCYSKGFNWDGLYEIFHRVSCWCCPLQPIADLRQLRKHFPELWEELRDMDRRTWFQFKATYTVEDLNTRFILEDEREAQGLPINTKDFYAELKSRLGKTQLEVKE